MCRNISITPSNVKPPIATTAEQRSILRAERKARVMKEMIAKGGATAAAAPTQRNNIMYAGAAFVTGMVCWSVLDSER